MKINLLKAGALVMAAAGALAILNSKEKLGLLVKTMKTNKKVKFEPEKANFC